ncbi:MAG: ABC transporter permease [Anaerolineae bacterium]|nr:ABC transporter permease [Anaerolineae bacterium]
MKGLGRFFSRWTNVAAILIIFGFIGVALAAPYLAPPDDPENPAPFRVAPAANGSRTTSSRQVPRPPAGDVPLGTVTGGLDVFYSLVWGTRAVLRFGFLAALGTACFGVVVGALSGYTGGLFNRLVMRITDAFLTFPSLAGVFLFRRILLYRVDPLVPLSEVQTALPVILAFVMFSWMPYARLINANVLKLKQTDFALAAKTVGAPPLRIVFRHLAPNAMAPAIVLLARDIGGLVILEAAFTFIGLGAGLPWGVLLVAGRDWIVGPGGNPLTYWWVFLPATLALVLYGIGWNLLGDGLNTWFNPRARHATFWYWKRDRG